MRVIHLSAHCCIRVIKEATAIQNAGIADCIFIQNKTAHPAIIYMAPLCAFYIEGEALIGKLQGITDARMIHVHSEPSGLGHFAKRVRPDLPVIFDAHDMNLVRGKGDITEEIKSFEECDGFIFPSHSMMRTAIKAVPSLRAKPCEVIYSMVNEEVINPPDLPRINGIVYEGGIRTSGSIEDPTPFDYRDWREAFAELTDMGIPVHVYGATSEDVQSVYGDLGCVVYPQHEYSSLLHQLTRYDWGLVGAPIRSGAIETCMPNKLFEYIAAGIPVLSLNAGEVSEFVEKHGLGLTIKSIHEIPAIYGQHEKFRRVVREKREQFTMETQLPKIEKLYAEVLKRHGK